MYKRRKMDFMYELDFLYDSKNSFRLQKIDSCIDRMNERTHEENVTVFGEPKYIYYALCTKYEFYNTERPVLRSFISILLFLAIVLIQIPAIQAFFTILSNT